MPPRDPTLPPPVVSLLGHSGTGKTTTAVALVTRWSGFGWRVGYVKHASHGFQMDREGKDTDRAARAGAVGVAVTGPEGLAFVEPASEPDPLAIVRRFFASADVVVVEGFRGAPIPAVVIAGADGLAPLLPEVGGPVIAVVTGPDTEAGAKAKALGVPTFTPGDMTSLARHLESVLALATPTDPSSRSVRK